MNATISVTLAMLSAAALASTAGAQAWPARRARAMHVRDHPFGDAAHQQRRPARESGATAD